MYTKIQLHILIFSSCSVNRTSKHKSCIKPCAALNPVVLCKVLISNKLKLQQWNVIFSLVWELCHICSVPLYENKFFFHPQALAAWNLNFAIEELMESVIKQLISSYSNSLPILKWRAFYWRLGCVLNTLYAYRNYEYCIPTTLQCYCMSSFAVLFQLTQQEKIFWVFFLQGNCAFPSK